MCCESERLILGLANVFYLERRRGGLRCLKDEIDAETCSAKTVTLMEVNFQGGVEDHVVEFLLWLGGMWVGRHENVRCYPHIGCVLSVCLLQYVSLLPWVNFDVVSHVSCSRIDSYHYLQLLVREDGVIWASLKRPRVTLDIVDHLFVGCGPHDNLSRKLSYTCIVCRGVVGGAVGVSSGCPGLLLML